MSQQGEVPTGQEPVDRKSLLMDQFTEAEDQAKAEAANVVTEDESKDRFSPHFGKPAGRPRDEVGRFVAKEKTEQQEQAPQEQAPAPEPWQSAPKSWKKELAEGWGNLDPNYQRYVHEREEQMRQGIEPLLPKAELADRISEVAAPYMATIQGLGIDLPRAVAGLMQVDHGLRTLPFEQKLQLLYETALSYGIDISGQLPKTQQLLDPVFQAQQQELLQLKGQFSSFIQQQEAAEQQAALQEIQMFGKKAEHFDEVKLTMAKLLQSGFAVGLDDAYEHAIRLTPEIFDKVQQARQASADLARRQAADEAAKRARAAAVSVRSATPGAKTITNAKDRRSVLMEAFDSLSERL